jgi:heme oxygenase
MRSPYLALAGLVALGAFGLAACGGSGGNNNTTTTTTAASAKDTFCADLKNASTALTELQGIDPKTASIADIKSAASDLKDAGQQVATSAKALGQADVSAVQSAVGSLQTAVKSLPKGNSIQQDLTQLQAALQTTAQSLTTIFNGQGCKTSSS